MRHSLISIVLCVVPSLRVTIASILSPTRSAGDGVAFASTERIQPKDVPLNEPMRTPDFSGWRNAATMTVAVLSGIALLRNSRRRRFRSGLPSAHDQNGEVASSAPPAPQASVLICVFLYVFAFAASSPVLPALREHFELRASQTGALTSGFPLGMFLANFVFPALSDKFGRKPLIVISYLGVGTLTCLQSVAIAYNLSLHVYVGLRIMTGAFAGASAVMKAYIADTAGPDSLPHMMAYLQSAVTVAFIVGPTLGGNIFAWTNLEQSVFFQGFAVVLAGVLAKTFLEDKPTRPTTPAAQQQIKEEEDAGEQPTSGVFGMTTIVIMVVQFAYNIGLSFYDAFFSVHCSDRFGMSAPAIGSVQTVMAMVALAVTTWIYSPLVRRVGLVQISVIGLSLVALALTNIGYPKTWSGTQMAVLLYTFGIPLCSPSLPALLSLSAPRSRRGLVLGCESAATSVGRILSPLVLGGLYEANPSYAFAFVGFVVAAGTAWLLLNHRWLSLLVKDETSRQAVPRDAAPRLSASVVASRAWALGFWIVNLGYAAAKMGFLASRLRFDEMSRGELVGLVSMTLGMAYCEGFRGFQRSFSPVLVRRALALDADTPWYVHVLGPFYVGGFFDGTRKRLIVSWGLLFIVSLLGAATARCPYPWRQIIDAGCCVGLGWGAASIVYFVYLAATGKFPEVDGQFGRKPAQPNQMHVQLSSQTSRA